MSPFINTNKLSTLVKCISNQSKFQPKLRLNIITKVKKKKEKEESLHILIEGSLRLMYMYAESVI